VEGQEIKAVAPAPRRHCLRYSDTRSDVFAFYITQVSHSLAKLFHMRLVFRPDEEKSDARLLGLLLRLGHHSTASSTATTRVDKRAAFFIVHLVLEGSTLAVIGRNVLFTAQGRPDSSTGNRVKSPQD
jgi:hypothetical protein